MHRKDEYMKLLEMKNVQKSFGGLEVLKDISLDVNKGEVVAIIGPSGSGKSTTLFTISAHILTKRMTFTVFFQHLFIIFQLTSSQGG